MKFSMENAWDGATASIRANRDLLLVLGGLFFFIPSLLLAILLPQPDFPPDASPEQMIDMLGTYFGKGAPYMLGNAVVGMIGTLAMLALLSDPERPTVGEALKRGGVGLVSYIAAGLVTALGMGVIGAVLIGIPSALGASMLLPVAVLIVAVLGLYITIKTSLTPVAIIKDRLSNPIAALKRSWQLTKGNSLRLLLFYALLFIPYIIIVMIVGSLFAALGGLFGNELRLFVGGIGESLVVGAWGVLQAAVMASIHRQLSGGGKDDALIFD